MITADEMKQFIAEMLVPKALEILHSLKNTLDAMYEPFFKLFDKNSDGKLSKKEVVNGFKPKGDSARR